MATSTTRSRLFNLFDKIRYRRFISRSNQSSALQKAEEQDNESHYPPIKPKYPPGEWGEMDRGIAWTWHEEGEKWKSMASVEERLSFLATKDSKYGSKVWKYNSIQTNTGLSDYQQDKTKTVLINDAPEVISNIDIDIENEFKDIKTILQDKLLEEQEYLVQHLGKMYDPKKPEALNTKLIKSLVFDLVTVLSTKYEHLFDLQLDPEVEIAAYWDRYGVPPIKPWRNYEKAKTDYSIPTWPLPKKFFQNYSKYQSQSKLSCQLRTSNPLPEFLPQDDVKCTSEPYPECRLWPNVLGTPSGWVQPKCDPGYVPQDPYQFVNLSFVPRNLSYLPYLEKNLGAENAAESLKYFGMNTAFISTVAQAYNQGFSTFVDITYPFTTQTIMTDGRLFSIYSYQLNTLHLWKGDEVNPLRNICFLQDSLPLYDVIENGQIKGFNDETFKALMRCFVLKPVDRGCDLRPTIPQDSPNRMEPEIPKYVEEIIIEKEVIYDES
ncbi:small subunit ribosomal protein S30 [Mytilus galloprovincialis]|uniref:Small subunit ribosomal protein S30 n=1 Tax=Mytilus galloprovincialis TaxID=29158 RepID=A0A8B6FL48_MYTGA|nr:small subunit ribosomal protein S30 [Mytilus galloprovincialis]